MNSSSRPCNMKLGTLLLLAVLLRECSSVVWGPKESSSGVRGRGQKRPLVLKASAGELIEDDDELEPEDIADQLGTTKRLRRQSSIGYTTRLSNDNHDEALVHWTGHPSQSVFILTRDLVNGHSEESWLWRSINYGHNYTNETNKLPDDAIVESYYISPYSQYLIFTDIKLNKVYITENEGETYTEAVTPFTPDNIVFQSVRAPNSTESPYSKYVLGYDSSTQQLWVSMNLGKNWVKIGDNVPTDRYYWRRLGSDIEGDLSTVYYEQRTSASSNNSMLYMWNSSMAVGQMGQLFNRDLGEFRSESFVLEHEYMFVQKPETTDVSTLHSPLWVSYKRSTTFVQSSFPFVTAQQHYSVIDASEGQVFIAVYHIGNTSNLYISEEKGVNYSLTLEDIISPPDEDWVTGNPTIDVHVVEGVVGTYFANRHKYNSDYGTTVVSFDKGGTWNALTPPALKWNGRPVTCVPPSCSVHLHMDIDAEARSQYRTILSQESAVGLIVAVGNFGSRLASNYRRFYFSRDGGFTWAEVQRGFWQFEIAALGSIVVAVKANSRVSNVLWSCDEGASWYTANFVAGSSTRVLGISTEEGERSRHVTVYGFDGEWLFFDLDFTSVVSRQCDRNTDYYDWIPTDERPGSRCLLGEVISYERRNASECCYVDPDYEKGTVRSVCDCAIEDFECDFGFVRDNLNSPCLPYPGLIYPPDPPDDCPEGENYTYTSGYRKVAGDKCVPGEETYFFPITRPCPIQPPRFLVIGYSPGQVRAGDVVTFTLTQFDGAVMSTRYTWNYNDSSDPLSVIGLANARQQTHTFARPGVYVVSMVADNEAGSSEVVQTVRVLDAVKSIEIVPPDQIFNDQVPTTISLLFGVTVTSQYETDLLDIRDYQWDFGDGSSPSPSDLPSNTHTYSSTGTYTVTASVHAPFVIGSGDASLSLIVYEATSVVDVIANSSGQVTGGGTTYVPLSTPVLFYPRPQQSGIQLPPDTVNTWHVVKTSPVAASGIDRTVADLEYSFTSWGVYLISVIGRSDRTSASFVGQLSVTAESQITTVSVDHIPAARTASIVLLKFTISDSAGLYQGPLILSILVNNTVAASSTTVITGLATTLSVEASGRGEVEYSFVADNDLSRPFKGKTTLIVVDTGEYGSVTLQFSDFPSNFNDSVWQEKLKMSVKSAIVNAIPTDQHQLVLVEVVAVRAVEQDAADSPDYLKRAAESNKVLYLYVDANILPLEYSSDRIASAKQLAQLVVTDAKNGNLIITVDKQTLTISSAHIGTGGTIIEPPVVIDQFDSSKYAAIGGALGAFLILAVVISVALAVIVYFYRRKYTRLRVRYSRLHQSPVKYSFTAKGEIVENEDESDDADLDL